MLGNSSPADSNDTAKSLHAAVKVAAVLSVAFKTSKLHFMESTSTKDRLSGVHLVQEPELAVLRLFVGRVQEDAAVQDGAVDICDHAANIT